MGGSLVGSGGRPSQHMVDQLQRGWAALWWAQAGAAWMGGSLARAEGQVSTWLISCSVDGRHCGGPQQEQRGWAAVWWIQAGGLVARGAPAHG